VETLAQRVAIIRAGEIVEVAETSSLTHGTLSRMTVRFKRPTDFSELVNLPGIELLSQVEQTSITLQVTGDMERLVQVLGLLPVLDLETERPSLEDAFLDYYQKEQPFTDKEKIR
jgi:ABC-2 type transport system ATP-binding protein